jgi:hypothetical protein
VEVEKLVSAVWAKVMRVWKAMTLMKVVRLVMLMVKVEIMARTMPTFRPHMLGNSGRPAIC